MTNDAIMARNTPVKRLRTLTALLSTPPPRMLTNREEESKHQCAVSHVWSAPNRAFMHSSLTMPLPRGCCSTARSLVSKSSNRALALPGPDLSRASICRRRSAISWDSVCRRFSTVCRSTLIWECITCTVSGWVDREIRWDRGKQTRLSHRSQVD